MGVETVTQKNFNVGEVDPLLQARSDLKVYFAALALAENVVTSPLGAILRRPGTTYIDTCRHVLDPVAVVEAMVAAPNGGTPAKAVAADGDLFNTTADLGAADQVLIQVDFGAPQDIYLIDLIDYAAVPTGGATTPTAPPVSYPWIQPGQIQISGIGGLGDLP